MTNEGEGKVVPPGEDEKCVRPLLCSEEWKEPSGRKVLGEYHKEGLTDDEADVERDLDAFEKYWRDKAGINLQGEYHKEGAPYLEDPSGWDGHRPRLGQVPEVIVEEIAVDRDIHVEERSHIVKEVKEDAIVQEVHVEEQVHVIQPPPSEYVRSGLAAPVEKVFADDVHIEATQQPIVITAPPESKLPEKDSGTNSEPVKSESPVHETEPQKPKKSLHLSEVLDINTVEVISYLIVRAIWGKEFNVPIKKEGMADIDIHVKGKDITVNTNQLFFSFPELVVWHITYTHKGRPVLEIGRGVKNGMKLHYYRAARLLLEVWFGNKASVEAKKADNVGKGNGKQNQGGKV